MLDAKFMGLIARQSHRLGLIDTEGWAKFQSKHYGDGKYLKDGQKSRPKLNALLNEFLAEAWTKGTVGEFLEGLLPHQQ